MSNEISKKMAEIDEILIKIESGEIPLEEVFEKYKEAISKAVEEAKKHQNSEDKDELEKALKDLQDAIMPIGAKLYQAQSADNAGEAGEKAKTSHKKDNDEPVEGEVIDKK